MMICANCNHEQSYHLAGFNDRGERIFGGVGACTQDGCVCNQFRFPEPNVGVLIDPPPLGTPVQPQMRMGEQASDDGGKTWHHDKAAELPDETAQFVDRMMRNANLLALIPEDFILAMGNVMEAGVKGDRTAHDWMELAPQEVEKKLRSAMRHLANGEYDAAACNCLILWWHLQRGDRVTKQP